MRRGFVVAFAVFATTNAARADPLEIPDDASTIATLEAAVAQATLARLRTDTPPALRLVVEAELGTRGAPLVQRMRDAVEAAARESATLVADADYAMTLRLDVARGRFRIRLAVGGAPSRWWRRFFGFAADDEEWSTTAALDAELRPFVAPLPPLGAALVPRSARLPGRGYLAMRVHDADRDGRPELLLLRDDALDIARLTEESIAAVSTAAGSIAQGRRLRAVAVASVPVPALPEDGVGTRRAFGTLTVVEGRVLGRLRRHTAPFALSEAGTHIVAADDPCPGAHPLDDACAAPVDGRDYYASELLTRVGGRPPERAPTSFYTRERRLVRRAEGSVDAVEVVVTPRGRLVARTGDRTVGLSDYGVALGMADVDLDGSAELVASSSALVGAGDQLRVLRIRPDGTLLHVWDSPPLEGSVMVAGAGDLDGDGVAELLAIEERDDAAYLWVIR